MTNIEEYYKWSLENPNKVSNKVKILLEKLYKDLTREQVVERENLETGEIEKQIFIYDSKKANRPIEFIERFCVHSKGKFNNKPFKLEVWQKAIIESMYGFVDKKTGFRKYKKVQMYIGRKNGKSTLASALALYHLFADGENGAEIYSVAVKKDQAKIVWEEAKNMVKSSKHLRKVAKTTISDIRYADRKSIFKPLASDSNSLDGLNSSFVTADEIHAWKNMDLLNVMYDSMAARMEPILFMTTTMGFVRQNVFDKEYDFASKVIDGYKNTKNAIIQEELLPWIFELDNETEIEDKEKWYKANPGLGTIKKFDFLEDKVKVALQNPIEKPNILTKDFNIAQTSYSRWLTFDEAKNTETFELEDFKNFYAVGGTDLSSTTDLTCATVLIPTPEKIFVKQMYFIPQLRLEDKIREDKIPYDIWEKRGLVKVTEGAKVDYSDITKWYYELYKEYGIVCLNIGYDPWGSTYWVEEMKSYGFTMREVIQGARTMSSPMKVMYADLQMKKINYNANPILHWCLVNTEIKRDENDNIRPVKGRNVKERIDGCVSLINAYVVYQDLKEDLHNLNKYKYGT